MSGSCEKEDLTSLKGTYTGTFIYSFPESSATPQRGDVTITFNGSNFHCSANPDRIPAGGAGTVTVINDQQVKFEDQNMWTADFDWGLILDGTYAYEVRGDSMFLAKYRDDLKVYEYRLKRNQ